MNEAATNLKLAVHQAMRAGDFATAEGLVLRMLAQEPKNITLLLNLAAARRQLGNLAGAYEALREVLRIEPRHFHALLMTATMDESERGARAAAVGYAKAIAQAPPQQYLDPPTLQALAHAREVHEKYTRELHEFIKDNVGDARSQCSRAEQHRLDIFVANTLRTRKRYQQEPTDYLYPELPAIEFYDRDEFPWLGDFEAATSEIQRELATIVEEDEAGFQPYIHYPDHLPLDQWRELNHSPRWTAFHFFERGQPIEERWRRAPATMQAVGRLPQPQVPLRSPTAMFSVLQPKTRIPAHTGVANFRLVVHLPLIVPAHCGFRVGGETREWRVGEAWVFDDTIEHEAWNDSDQTRIIFICDIWNPRLTEEERVAIARVIDAADSYNDTQPSAHI
jgi:aspartyl/asparaginyl beta-hydroxylase (cupin superfamily)